MIWDSWKKKTGTFKFLSGTCHTTGTLLISDATKISKILVPVQGKEGVKESISLYVI